MRQTLIALTLLFSFTLSAQQGNWCGTFNSPEDRAVQKNRLLNNLQTIASGVVQFRDILLAHEQFLR